MQPESDSICTFGAEDLIPTDPESESFVRISISDLDTRELKIQKFNMDNYQDPRVQAGYICELEGIGVQKAWYCLNFTIYTTQFLHVQLNYLLIIYDKKKQI